MRKNRFKKNGRSVQRRFRRRHTFSKLNNVLRRKADTERLFAFLSILMVLLVICVGTVSVYAYQYGKVDAIIAFDCIEPKDNINVTYCICIKSDNESSPMPVNDTVDIDQSGQGEFRIEITESGTFVYRLYQIKGTDVNVTYDDTEYRCICLCNKWR